jgi:hypothetical protein
MDRRRAEHEDRDQDSVTPAIAATQLSRASGG